nr:cytochrome B561 and DOMON domain-containing protein At3g61750-like [Ipomoea batatas]
MGPISSRLQELLVVIFIIIVSGRSNNNVEAQNTEVAQDKKALCSISLASFLPPPYGAMENMICQPLWNSNFLLRYSQTKDNVVTIVASTLYTSGWVGIGFSRNGKMINSSSMVGWITPEGKARIRQYLLEGFKPSQVKHDKGELPLTTTPPLVVLQGATIYLAFQLKFPMRLRAQPIILAFAHRYPHHLRLTNHDDKTTINFDFSTGASYSVSVSPSGIMKTKKTHGVLGMMGWGVFSPSGAIFARYLRNRGGGDNALWYYLHVSTQFIGFILGLAGVVMGLRLYTRMHAHVPAHRGIGIFVLLLSILQVLAFFLRPHEDSKHRKYWNLYHSWVGRIALFFGALNIVLGIHYAEAGDEWQIGYGFLLGSTLLACIILETLLRMKNKKLNNPPHHRPDFPMNSMDH